MITAFDVKRDLDLYKDNDKVKIYASDDMESILNKEDGSYFCSMETFLQKLREHEHCDFETIYYEHGSLTHIYKCRQCGTVIFGGDDERWNPNEKCPTCCHDKSVCHNTYWTQEEIFNDLKKQEVIDWYVMDQLRMDEEYKRRKARGGLYDWQRFVKKIETKKFILKISLINYDWGSDKPWYNWFSYIEFSLFIKNKSESVFDSKYVEIPLTPYALKSIIRSRKIMDKEM